jgi:threonine dehydratase
VYGVQARGASVIHDSWHAKTRLAAAVPQTFADGLATGATYDLTWEPLRDGLAGFVAVSDAQIADAIRLLLRTTHNLAEGAGAAGLAGLRALDALRGKICAVVLSGSNIDGETLKRVMTGEL